MSDELLDSLHTTVHAVDTSVKLLCQKVDGVVARLDKINGSVGQHDRDLRRFELSLVEHISTKGHQVLTDDVNRLGQKVEVVRQTVEGLRARMAVWAGVGAAFGAVAALVAPPLLASLLGGSP